MTLQSSIQTLPRLPYCFDMLVKKFQVFSMIEYEDELDILVVVVTTGGCDSDGAEAKVHLVDNQSGKLLRIVPLDERWDDVSDLTCNGRNNQTCL